MVLTEEAKTEEERERERDRERRAVCPCCSHAPAPAFKKQRALTIRPQNGGPNNDATRSPVDHAVLLRRSAPELYIHIYFLFVCRSHRLPTYYEQHARLVSFGGSLLRAHHSPPLGNQRLFFWAGDLGLFVNTVLLVFLSLKKMTNKNKTDTNSVLKC